MKEFTAFLTGIIIGGLFILFMFILITTCAKGREHYNRYPNKTCDDKLTCLKGYCVDLQPDAGH
jgi:hypothetical protein